MRRVLFALAAISIAALPPSQAQTQLQDIQIQDAAANAAYQSGSDAFRNGNHTTALEQFLSACEFGHTLSCDNIKIMFQDANLNLPDPIASRNAYADGCDISEVASCHRIGLFALNGIGGDVDLPLARKSYFKACELRPGTACVTVAQMQASGVGGDVDLSAGSVSMQKACDADYALGCYGLANLAIDGPEPFRDDIAARDALTRSCNLGLEETCATLGYFMATGRGGPVDTDGAMPLLEPACETDNGEACALLGVLQIGVDDESARANVAKACRLDQMRGCYEYGRYIETDPITAIIAREVYKKSCDGDYGEGCAAYAELLSQGIGGDKDQGRAMEYYQKACDAGHGTSCDLLTFSALGELEKAFTGPATSGDPVAPAEE